jgi:hypothetical protein
MTVEKICRESDLLHCQGGVVRAPFLIKGKIIVPPEINMEQIEAAFRDADKDTVYVKLSNAQLIREPVIDRKTLRYTGEYVYQVLPPVSGPELVETNIDRLVHGLYALFVADILEYLELLSAALLKNQELVGQVREICRLTVEHPDAFLDGWFAAFPSLLNREAARQMINNELSLWGRPGGDFLDGWVEVPAGVVPGLVPSLAQALFGQDMTAHQPVKTLMRAMPTRQLHITAGNAPVIPIVSALCAILTKSAAVIKSPYGATITGALFGLAAAAVAPDHPITQNLSVVYWPGGDESIESLLFRPNAFDRIVVWGTPETITSVQSKAPFTKTVCFNPRYGVSLIGREAFDGSLEKAVVKAAMDSMIDNQKACIASLVHYIEGTEEQARSYAERLRQTLRQWDGLTPQFVLPAVRGQLKRMKRGKYSRAHWYINSQEEEFTSGVIVMPGEFDILDHPMCRLVIVRPVDNLTDVLRYLHQGVSTVGIYPEERRLALRDRILARGVSNVLPLGQCERIFAGMPHDGMMVLSQLVDWKNA